MSGVLRTRDAIVAILRDPASSSPEEVAGLAEAYAAACADAAARLQRCAQYLDRGMRAEAVHLAACPPDLARAAASLRLPDAAAWESLCVRHGRPRPPRVPFEVVDRLAVALDEDRRLTPLLGRLRVSTLARAPLADRLAALRAVRAADAANPLWADELLTLETPRLEQLRAEADRVLAAGDEAALAALSGELESPEWVTPVDEHFVRAVRDRLADVRRAAALAELPLQALLAAYERRAFEECAALLERWRDVTDRNQLTLPEDLQQQVRPVVNWVAAESRKRTLEQRRDLAASVAQSQAAATPAAAGRARRALRIAAAAAALAGTAGWLAWAAFLR